MQTLRLVLVYVCLLIAVTPQQAQSALNLKYGLLQLRFSDEQSSWHFGQSFGFDVLVEDSRLLFMPGLHYQQYTIAQRASRNGSRNQDFYHQIQLPVNLGTWIFADRYFKLRVYGGGHLNFLIGVDKNSQGVTSDNTTAVHPGVQAGTQVMIWRFTFDVRYIHDFRKYILQRPESRLLGWEFLFGVAL